jgi:Tetracyclin repressor-like, C-terminal domain
MRMIDMDTRRPSSDPSPWMPFESRRRAPDEKREALLCTALQSFLDPRDLSEKNRKIMRASKKSVDLTFRRYITEGIADRSIKPCDAKLAAFAIAGSLNWIGHWFQPDGALSADAIADEFSVRLTEGLATKPIRQGRNQHP